MSFTAARLLRLLTACMLGIGSTVCFLGVEAAFADESAARDDRVLSPESEALVRQAANYGLRQLFREVARPADEPVHFGLELDAGALATPAHERITIFIHGFHSNPQRHTALLGPIRTAGIPCGTFCYAFDKSLSEAAAFLSQNLKAFAQRAPQRRLALVTHSMGGLVARECLENPELDPGNIERLIMIAPPSQGTMLAQAAVARPLEVLGGDGKIGEIAAPLYGAALKSAFSAAADLAPGSKFLERLNARQRHANVRYAILLGSAGALQQTELHWIRLGIQALGDNLPAAQQSAGKVDALLSEMDELVEGKGDGVVAIQRGTAPGIDDVLILPFNHHSVTGEGADATTERVRQEVLLRLQ